MFKSMQRMPSLYGKPRCHVKLPRRIMSAPTQTIVSPERGAPIIRGAHPGEGIVVHDHGLEETSVTVGVPVKDGIGQIHVTAATLKNVLGVSDSDALNINSVGVQHVTKDFDETVIGSVKAGDDSDYDNGSRQTYIHPSGAMVTGLFVAHKDGPQTNAVITMPSPEQEHLEDMNRKALSRAETWHEHAYERQQGRSVSHDVRSVALGGKSRMLVPVHGGSGMSKSFMMNRNNGDYCDGKYSEDAATVVDLEGKPHIVVHAGDYAAKEAEFHANLDQTSDISKKDGFLVKIQSPSPHATGMVHTQLQIKRTPVGTVLADDFAGADVELANLKITSREKMQLDGSDAAVSLPAIGNPTQNELANAIFGADVGDSGDEAEEQPTFLNADLDIKPLDNGSI
jgi:hypothetical protein